MADLFPMFNGNPSNNSTIMKGKKSRVLHPNPRRLIIRNATLSNVRRARAVRNSENDSAASPNKRKTTIARKAKACRKPKGRDGDVRVAVMRQ